MTPTTQVTDAAAGPPAETAPPPSLWSQHARHWSLIKPPLRPCTNDLAPIQQAIDDWVHCSRGAPTVLILGVTPEFAQLRWPDGTRVYAADMSMPMIRSVLPRGSGCSIGPRPVQANWLALPFPDQSFDFVIGDGCYVLLRCGQAPLLSASVHRLLRSHGRFVVRVFLRPDHHEPHQRVFDRLLAGNFGNFHVFKFRLLMSLAGENGDVRVADAHRLFLARFPSPEALAAHSGWPLDEIRTIDAYRDQPGVYGFPTATEYRNATAAFFVETACFLPEYEMGECCPTFVFRNR